ncbi:MAG: phosphotransferase [Candidatus Nealsonbacteria bacterium]
MEKDIELITKLNSEWRLKEIKVIKAGGQTNRNWIVKHKGKRFFVRFPWERTDIVDRKIEGRNILAISRSKKLIGVVPRFFVYVLGGKNILNPKEKLSFPDGTMVMEHIEGRDINGRDLEREKYQRGLVNTLYKFHASGVRFVNVYDVFHDEVLKYRRKAKKYPIGKLLNKTKVDIIEKIEEVIKRSFYLAGKISTHNDLIFENLRLGKDGKIYILDFEYAGYNVRDGLHYDLGIILGGNLFYRKPISLKSFEEFLEKAKKRYKKNLVSKNVYRGALANVLVMFWWGIIKYFSSKTKAEKKYFKHYVLARAKGIEALSKFVDEKNKALRGVEKR